MAAADWPRGEPMTQSECFPEAFYSIGRRSWGSPSPGGLGAMRGLALMLSLLPPVEEAIWRVREE